MLPAFSDTGRVPAVVVGGAFVVDWRDASFPVPFRLREGATAMVGEVGARGEPSV